MNNILIKNNDSCSGCGMCEAVCPQNCIEIYLDEEGFYKPKIDQEKCIECGCCIEFCVKFNKIIEKDETVSVYSAKNKDTEILKKSTSGGVSYELMKECIDKGYFVVGASYNYKKEKTFSKMAKNYKDLNLFFGSKYMPSYSSEELKNIIRNKNQRYAIFGTPCQIYPLFMYANKNKIRDKFLFIELFCHGCPSQNLWDKYLEENKKKFKCNSFQNIEFRSKINGWHEYSFLFENNHKKYKTSRIKNDFTELFFDLNVLNKACYDCKLRSTLNYSDIRLGDFWGKKYDLDKEGVSAVVINSKKGENFFKNIQGKFNIRAHVLDEVLEGQSYKKKHKENKKIRQEILKDLSGDKDMKKILIKYRKNYTFSKKIKNLIVKILKCLPQSLYFRIKKCR